MPCDHQFLQEHLDALSANTLSEAQEQELAHNIEDCDLCAQMHASIMKYAAMARQWQEQPAPEWNRKLQPFRQLPARVGWWHFASLTVSACAMLLVLLNTQISLADGFSIRFGQPDTTGLQELISTQLAEANATSLAETRALLDEFYELQTQQQTLSLNRVINQSRAERREELEALNLLWQNQRLADQRQFGRQVNQLATYQLESNEYINTLARTAATSQR